MHNVDIRWGAMQSKKRVTLLGLQCTFVCRLVSTPFDNWAGKMGIYVRMCVCVCYYCPCYACSRHNDTCM